MGLPKFGRIIFKNIVHEKIKEIGSNYYQCEITLFSMRKISVHSIMKPELYFGTADFSS
jgi:hypothetical protein